MLRKTALVLLAGYGLTAFADDRKDPRLRDEDISATLVEVEITERADGLYSYVYTLTSPEANKGRISSFHIDLNCTHAFGEVALPVPNGGFFGGYNAPSDSITPTAVLGSAGGGVYGTAMNGFAMFGLALDSGETVTGLELVSPAAPGMRQYELKPSMDNGPEWAYPEDPDPTIPWIPDFTVTGSVAGPGCPGVTPTPPDAGRFAGTLFAEPEQTNALLTYSGVDKDQWHTGAESRDFTLTIHYAANIDPKTFKVQPGWAKRSFNPEPGGSETVTLPLKKAVNTFHFEVRPVDEQKGKKPEDPGAVIRDLDVFKIRVDVR